MANSPETLAVSETRKQTERLKLIYHKLSDEQRGFEKTVDSIREAIHTLRDENFAIGAALKAKGVRFDPQKPLAPLPAEELDTAPPKQPSAPSVTDAHELRAGTAAANAAAVSPPPSPQPGELASISAVNGAGSPSSGSASPAARGHGGSKKRSRANRRLSC